MTNVPPAELARFLRDLHMYCLDIRSVWSLDGGNVAAEATAPLHELVIFADAATLYILRRSDPLHRADVLALVVFDGERFENAWGAQRISGSLARWAWRQDGPGVAYYNHSNWSQGGEAGMVVRTRRKALLVWPALPALAQHEGRRLRQA